MEVARGVAVRLVGVEGEPTGEHSKDTVKYHTLHIECLALYSEISSGKLYIGKQ